MDKLSINVSVSSLLSGCPRYILWHAVNPTEDKSFDLSFGTLVHLSISEHGKSGEKAIDEKIVEQSISTVLPEWQKAGAYNQLFETVKTLTQAALGYLEANDYIGKAQYEVPVIETIGNIDIRGIADVVGNNHVIDWKTGSYINKKHKIQVAIYCYLLSKHGLISIPCQGIIVYIYDTIKQGFPTVIDFAVDEESIELVDTYITSLLKLINEQGDIPRQGDNCRFCPYKKLCFA